MLTTGATWVNREGRQDRVSPACPSKTRVVGVDCCFESNLGSQMLLVPPCLVFTASSVF